MRTFVVLNCPLVRLWYPVSQGEELLMWAKERGMHNISHSPRASLLDLIHSGIAAGISIHALHLQRVFE